MEIQPPTPEQLERRKRRQGIIDGIESGEITDINQIDPKETSIETVQEARQRLRLGRRSLDFAQSGL